MTQRWDHIRFLHFSCICRQQFWKQLMNIIIFIIVIIIIIIIIIITIIIIINYDTCKRKI